MPKLPMITAITHRVLFGALGKKVLFDIIIGFKRDLYNYNMIFRKGYTPLIAKMKLFSL